MTGVSGCFNSLSSCFRSSSHEETPSASHPIPLQNRPHDGTQSTAAEPVHAGPTAFNSALQQAGLGPPDTGAATGVPTPHALAQTERISIEPGSDTASLTHSEAGSLYKDTGYRVYQENRYYTGTTSDRAECIHGAIPSVVRPGAEEFL